MGRGLKKEVKNIADDGDAAYHPINENVGCHPEQSPWFSPCLQGYDKEINGKKCWQGIANHWDESDYGVESKAERPDTKAIIKEMSDFFVVVEVLLDGQFWHEYTVGGAGVGLYLGGAGDSRPRLCTLH